MSSVKSVKIFNEEYRIKTTSDDQYVEQIVKYVNDTMRGIEKGLAMQSVKKIAILAALNIADEYFKQKNKYEDHIKELEKKVESLTSSLDDLDFDID